jgi:exodeoxyribonuclease VII small subunit
MTKKSGFEKQLEKLEAIREELESGDITLDDSIVLFEKGMKQLKLCQQQLKKYEKKIEELSVEDLVEEE